MFENLTVADKKANLAFSRISIRTFRRRAALAMRAVSLPERPEKKSSLFRYKRSENQYRSVFYEERTAEGV